MSEEFLLLNPGPVPLTDDVRGAMDEPLVSHRSTAFEATYERAQRGLDYVFSQSTLDGRTTGDGTSLILNGTATMGMEMAVANLTDTDSEVVTLVNGKFGRRFKRIAERHAHVTPVEVEWGESFDLDAVDRAITDDTDLVTMVHNETSTGLLNPVAEVGELAAEHDALFVVDGVTSIGGDAFHIDDWHVDVALTDAQKALAAPPGISAIYVTDRAAAAADGASAPFYADLDWHLRKSEDDQTPFTSAVPLFRALAVAVENIRDEGMESRIRRHRRQSRAFRAGFEAFGLDSFPTVEGPTQLSNTLTAIDLPELVKESPEEFFDAVGERNVSISGGQAHLGGEIFRVSNMGNLTTEQVLRGVQTVGEALNEVGVDCSVSAGVDAAREQLEE
ncbi:pyridoxal-phosphate-dependent aminotransferase family protein [Halocatena pleomorpha]|uniref:Alanine--glyoxylate aminotransferase family protein n=1 Tax=Halocatena pleomorpha TaxID=1785090 RepID=A0A3P3RKV2_9EURY|nr:alanine--glyoxylate aminotransferase family protein [Halocatena pleomorpha]RRJ33439.1 alanine--glyoxylate aminotransferase family protein [Halocatena pleomorpha]